VPSAPSESRTRHVTNSKAAISPCVLSERVTVSGIRKSPVSTVLMSAIDFHPSFFLHVWLGTPIVRFGSRPLPSTLPWNSRSASAKYPHGAKGTYKYGELTVPVFKSGNQAQASAVRCGQQPKLNDCAADLS